MGENRKTAVYIGKISNGTSDAINILDIAGYTEKNPLVRAVWLASNIPLVDIEHIKSMIKENDINRIVIAGHQPGMYKPFFTKAMAALKLNTDDVILADFWEYGAYKKADTDLAKAIVACAVWEVPFNLAADPGEYDVNPETLVLGGGIAGIQASLEIADGDNKVYLVEKTGTIGGHMAMFDKTFPTLDCAACILTPKMVEVGQHPQIELMTYCEVKEVSGISGNYKVKILKKARRVDISTCIGCGTCAEKCPSKVPSEFDSLTSLRKAIYIPFPQAVPNKYLIDAEHCTWVQKGKCGVCVKVCPVPDCIDLDAKDEMVEINVGNIVVATGFKTFDAARAEQFAHGKLPNVVTSLEFERLVNASGPTEGDIRFRTQDKKGNWIFTREAGEPKSVALIHCVGSRDENYNKYCSKVCCMYSLKLAHLVKEKLPDAEVFEYYIDMRAYGKGYEEFYNRIDNEGIHIIRGRTAKIEQENGQLILRSEDIEGFKMSEQKVDMAILAVGLEPREDARDIAAMLGITVDNDGWFNELDHVSDPVNTKVGGITVAGVCQGPKDIPDTVAQASAASASVLQSIIKGKIRGNQKDLTLAEIETKAKELSKLKEVES